ncbi:flagellar hook protein FlgE [Aestuariibacter sp. A3R04]|uniref:flagellar hook protein FlgE n=1 Tax=Aestuariibacter sp. A3R04 TaxID=2841571 RepID=UPI001C09AB73|nr:flagellar hook-basal body complex protein [Aestuariibacter sp. A3R04]MBU3023143.1 flagellar hook-basal body complex protein [Aestuariibacter sp. A3R04]
MSMFQIGLSGLKSTQSALEVTSNNIANYSTSGFKSGTTEFASVYNGGQRGGVKVADVKDNFSESGEMVNTGNALDLAIAGKGFFTVEETDGQLAYTQAGQFSLDNNLYVVNANGARLQGYGVDDSDDSSIVSGILTDLKIEGSNLGAKPTDGIAFSGNLSSSSDVIAYPALPVLFDPTNGSAYNYSQSTEVYDSLGNSHVITQYFNHTNTNTWSAMYFVDGQPLSASDLSFPGGGGTISTQDVDINGTAVTAGVVEMSFDADGQLIPFGSENEVQLSFAPGGGAANMNVTFDLTNTTQYGSSFAMYENDPNGYTAGEFSGVTVDEDGKVYATFTNGESKLQGQLVLASFANVDGLQQGNNTVYYNTQESGAPLYGVPGTGVAGDLLSGSYMGSNVNISEQLVDLMSFQQNYQANAKTISSADEMMQILFGAV